MLGGEKITLTKNQFDEFLAETLIDFVAKFEEDDVIIDDVENSTNKLSKTAFENFRKYVEEYLTDKDYATALSLRLS
jgi:hypothetical protein